MQRALALAETAQREHDEIPVGASARCPAWWPSLRVGIWVVVIVLAAPVIFIDGIVVTLVTLRNATYTTNVTISLSYLNDAGRTYSCTYDYSTPNDAPMPPTIARQMNNQDWSCAARTTGSKQQRRSPRITANPTTKQEWCR